MILLADAVLAIKSDAEVNISGEDVTTIVWLDGNPTNITNQQILDKHAELQADYDAKQYQTNRKNEYPLIGDQLDMLWHSIDQDAALKQKYFAFHQAILAVKSKYPK